MNAAALGRLQSYVDLAKPHVKKWLNELFLAINGGKTMHITIKPPTTPDGTKQHDTIIYRLAILTVVERGFQARMTSDDMDRPICRLGLDMPKTTSVETLRTCREYETVEYLLLPDEDVEAIV